MPAIDCLLIDRFAGRRILVVGDIISDIYLEGRIARISREAPVMILEETGRNFVLGGAGNAAANIQSLGGQAHLAGLVGDDAAGRAIRDLAAGRGIDVSGLFLEAGRNSCTKTRILASAEHTIKQQLLRVDRLPGGDRSESVIRDLEQHLSRSIDRTDAVVISDYGLKNMPMPIYREALRLAIAAGKPVIVDSRYQLLEFSGATLLTPNVSEAEAALNRRLPDEAALLEAGRELLARMEPAAVLITRGPEGMSLFERDGNITYIPAANRQEVFDVSGAGDTVVAAVALGLAAGLEFALAARIANAAAGVVVRKLGTATVTPEELKAICQGMKT